MVATGPRPGSTPIAVPRSTPMKQYKMLVQVSACSKPNARFERISILVPANPRPEW